MDIHVGRPPDEYEVHVGSGILSRVGGLLGGLVAPGPMLVVTDENVAPLYLGQVVGSLEREAFSPKSVVLEPGEEWKSNDTLLRIYDELLTLGADRSTPIVALGGGVVGDISGFAAATWLRGLPWMAVPTTLLAQVDASVGGKTGVNHGRGKNLVGAFHPPISVLSDVETLKTLAPRQLRSGLAELLKTALILDADLFEDIERDPEILIEEGGRLVDAVSRSVRAKGDVVTRDLREGGLRRILNFGHTAGHAVEAACGYGPVLHGEAVAVGMVAAVRISIRRGLLDSDWELRLSRLLSRLGLPAGVRELAAAPDPVQVRAHLAADKKVEHGVITLVLLDGAGSARPGVESTADEVLEALYA